MILLNQTLLKQLFCFTGVDNNHKPLTFLLSDRDEGVFSSGHLILSHCVVTRQISRIYAGEVRGLQSTQFAITVAEYPRAIGARYQLAKVIVW